MRSRSWSAIVWIVAHAWFALASPTRASCFTPEPLLLWSYPAEGATDVPIDAELWAVSSFVGSNVTPTVKLNGQPVAVHVAPARPIIEIGGVTMDGHTGRAVLDAPARGIELEPIHFTPGALTPNTAYTLELSYRPTSTSPESIFEVHFTTGERKTQAPLKPKVVAYTDNAAGDEAHLVCRELLAAQGCFDTVGEQPTRLYAFQLASSNAIAWYVRTNKPDSASLWPSACGSPYLRVRESAQDECFELRPVGVGGKLGPALEYCARPAKSSKPFAPQPSAAGISPRSPTRSVAAPAPAPIAAPVAPTEPPPPVSPPKAPASASGGCSVSPRPSPQSCAWLIGLALLMLCWRQRIAAGSPLARRPLPG